MLLLLPHHSIILIKAYLLHSFFFCHTIYNIQQKKLAGVRKKKQNKQQHSLKNPNKHTAQMLQISHWEFLKFWLISNGKSTHFVKEQTGRDEKLYKEEIRKVTNKNKCL